MTIKLVFQMACIFRLECNFLNGYFNCLVASRNGRCQSENDAGHSDIPEEQNIANHQVQPPGAQGSVLTSPSSKRWKHIWN